MRTAMMRVFNATAILALSLGLGAAARSDSTEKFFEASGSASIWETDSDKLIERATARMHANARFQCFGRHAAQVSGTTISGGENVGYARARADFLCSEETKALAEREFHWRCLAESDTSGGSIRNAMTTLDLHTWPSPHSPQTEGVFMIFKIKTGQTLFTTDHARVILRERSSDTRYLEIVYQDHDQYVYSGEIDLRLRDGYAEVPGLGETLLLHQCELKVEEREKDLRWAQQKNHGGKNEK